MASVAAPAAATSVVLSPRTASALTPPAGAPARHASPPRSDDSEPSASSAERETSAPAIVSVTTKPTAGAEVGDGSVEPAAPAALADDVALATAAEDSAALGDPNGEAATDTDADAPQDSVAVAAAVVDALAP